MTGARRNLRVTHVITRLIVGGAQENTVSTVLGLRRKPGLDVQLISGTPEPGQGSLEYQFGGCRESLLLTPLLVRPIKPLVDFKALRALSRLFRSQRPDLVHTHSGKAGILGRWAAAIARTPIIVHSIHGPSFGPWQSAKANLLYRTLERAAGRVTTHFVTVAHAMIEQYLAAGIGSPEEYTRIFSGFPLEPFLASANSPALRARYGIAPDDLVIGKIARFFDLKGHDDLFEVMPAFFSEFPKACFLLIGGGPLESRFQEMAAANPKLKGRVVFTGLVSPNDIPALTGIMDCLVHLSRREGLPRALPQALAAGKPVIAYDCDGASEACLPGQTGLLISPGDKAGLLEALRRLAGDPGLRAQLGAAGQAFVRERFSVERMVNETWALYLRLFRLKHLAVPESMEC